jgi:hypothetical protein
MTDRRIGNVAIDVDYVGVPDRRIGNIAVDVDFAAGVQLSSAVSQSQSVSLLFEVISGSYACLETTTYAGLEAYTYGQLQAGVLCSATYPITGSATQAQSVALTTRFSL